MTMAAGSSDRLTVDDCVEIAWGIKDASRRCPRPTPREALEILNAHRPGYVWLTGESAIEVLTEHLARPEAYTAAELLEVEDARGVTLVGNPEGNGIAALAASAAAGELLKMWPGWFGEGLGGETFLADVEEVCGHLREWAGAVAAHVASRRRALAQRTEEAA
jgi:hypothetical protein